LLIIDSNYSYFIKDDRKNNETQKSQSVNDTDNFSYDKEYVIDHESIWDNILDLFEFFFYVECFFSRT
jgi:hypothetical protein